MDNDLMSLDIVENTWNELFDANEFKEFCVTLNTLDYYFSTKHYMEAVTDVNAKSKHFVSGAIKNTVSTTNNVKNAYLNIVDTNGNAIKNFWDLANASFQLVIKAANFVVKTIGRLPIIIVNAAKKVFDLPADIVNKIKGNIKLYITAEDIPRLYGYGLMTKLNYFLINLEALTHGNTWGTLFKNNTYVTASQGGIKKIHQNDEKLMNTLNSYYNNIANIQFTQSVIDLNRTDIVNIYFGKEKVIKFSDSKGGADGYHEFTYYEALNYVANDIRSMEDKLKMLSEDLKTKRTKTEVNQTFANLSAGDQELVITVVKNVSHCINIVGQMVKCIMTDVQTIDNTIAKLNKKSQANIDSLG